MKLKNWCILHRNQLILLAVLAIVIPVSIAYAWAGDLDVAQVPVITEPNLQTASDIADETHVIIVGAGAAGMSAAYALEYLGLNYTLLEASSRIGGRVRESPDFADVPLDLGAEWIHVMPRVLQDMILFDDDVGEVAKIKSIDYHPTEISSFLRGRQVSRNWLSAFYSEYKFYNTTWWSYFNNYMYPYIEDRTLFGAVVEEVRYDASGSDKLKQMTVTTKDGREFQGSHVIVAVPTRVLQDDDITFIPELSDRVWKAIDDIQMAHGMKVWFEWDEDFYPDWQSTWRVMGDDDVPLYFDAVWHKPSNRNIMCLFNVGPSATEVRPNRSDEQIVEDSLKELETIFDRSDLRSKLKQTMVQNWSKEPFIKGAYTWNWGEYDQAALRQPMMDGRLFLAGEHVADGDYHVATVHGAAITGREAVMKILKRASSASSAA